MLCGLTAVPKFLNVADCSDTPDVARVNNIDLLDAADLDADSGMDILLVFAVSVWI